MMAQRQNNKNTKNLFFNRDILKKKNTTLKKYK